MKTIRLKWYITTKDIMRKSLILSTLLCIFMLTNVRGNALSPAKIVVPANGEIINSSAKIPTELYICVPRRSSGGAMFLNIWANLIRKDMGEGIKGKWLLSYLDDVNVSRQPTQDETGYAGPFDINPKTEGLHKTYVVFEGDAEFEPCKSEEIILKVDPNLVGTHIVMEVTPVSGDAPLTIRVTGTAYEIGYQGAWVPKGNLSLDLMLFDYSPTCTKRLQPVKTVMNNPDGRFAFDYTFTKPGTYRVFVNFLGDDKYASDWSNNGETTPVNVTEG